MRANIEDMSVLLTASQTEPCFVINTDQFKETDIETIEDIIQKIPFVLDELKSQNQIHNPSSREKNAIA